MCEIFAVSEQRTVDRSREDHECHRGFPEAWGGYSGNFRISEGGCSRQVSRGRVPGEESTGVVCEDSPVLTIHILDCDNYYVSRNCRISGGSLHM